MKLDAATRRQVGASRPDVSTWVSANAGSGKTRVLTDRVARLLFQGVEPQRILCLTYTKAAASEMQNRLFERLGGWAMRPDDKLRAELQQMGEVGALTDGDLRHARQMFATAIETPGGLKIQTIHSFCAGVLRRFPLEAGVSPQFREIDDRAAGQLQQSVLDIMALDHRAALIDAVAGQASGKLTDICKAIVRRSDDILRVTDRADILSQFGLKDPDAAAALGRICAFSADDQAAIAAFLALPDKGSDDQKRALALAPFAYRKPTVDDVPILEKVFLYGAGAKKSGPYSAKIGSVFNKPALAALGPLADQIDDLAKRIEPARDARLAFEAADRAWALHDFGRAYLTEYRAQKDRAGWLDFDDLIFKTRDLLSDPRVAQWVLFRLDGGIDHILVDEAQDTSEPQWSVIEHLAQEFTAGEGVRGADARTIFVVGDRKQSIYSFQGAAPEAFAKMRDSFADRLRPLGKELAQSELSHSFRSAPAILNFVDQTLRPFADQGLGDHLDHLAFHQDRPGRVDVWPLVEPIDEPLGEPDWHRPVDQVLPDDPAVRLADAIAAKIRNTLASGTSIVTKDGVRRVRAGDFLILVQRRTGLLFTEILRALKAARLPVAGSDQLVLDDELAVKDLRSLLSFLALPRDDLALAETLRSPLLGWSEGDLYDIAQGRGDGVSLWQSLQASCVEDHPTRKILEPLLRAADFLGPFALLDRILTRFRGRQNLLARLGPEAEEGIDALLRMALQYERSEVASLTGFLTWLGADETTVKRQTDGEGNLIRVMTVHGAKGLEAPIVILPDTCSEPAGTKSGALLRDDRGLMWQPGKENMTPRTSAAAAASKARQTEERLRLLYVAMTRAESWLIVCGGAKKMAPGSWYPLITDGLKSCDSMPLETPVGLGMRVSDGAWPDTSGPDDDANDDPAMQLPDWTLAPAPKAERKPRTLSPSKIGGEKSVAGDPGNVSNESAEARERGTAIHLLLERLPACDVNDWVDVSQTLVGERADAEEILAEVTAVIKDPKLAQILVPDALVEVDLTASLPSVEGRRIRGTIDRLIVQDGRVVAVDYKSNAIVPPDVEQVPDGYLAQMGAYLEALEQIFPDHDIEVAILWTRNGNLMSLPHDTVKAALRDTDAS